MRETVRVGDTGNEERPTRAPRRPTLLADAGAALVALVLVGIAASLGFWQYGAWQARRTAEALDLTEMAPVPFAELMGNDDPFPAPDLGRPVEVSGDWIEGGFWVSGREYDGREGFWAVNPLALDDAAVLIVRGWAPEPSDALLDVTGTADVVGWMQPPEGGLATDDDASDDVFPEIRVADAVQRVDRDLYSAYVVADLSRTHPAGDLQTAELASLPRADRFTALRNLLYAVEWWIFGSFAGFIWWRWRRDATSSDGAPPSAG